MKSLFFYRRRLQILHITFCFSFSASFWASGPHWGNFRPQIPWLGPFWQIPESISSNPLHCKIVGMRMYRELTSQLGWMERERERERETCKSATVWISHVTFAHASDPRVGRIHNDFARFPARRGCKIPQFSYLGERTTLLSAATDADFQLNGRFMNCCRNRFV